MGDYEKRYIFKGFERFWHWTQAALIIGMMLTGFEIHGSYTLLGFTQAVEIHSFAAWLLIGLWVFAIFWHFTTGEWRQYIPTLDKMMAQIRFYAFGIFRGAPHPYHPTPERKLNPLQRAAYLFLKLIINPLLWISGLVYLFYNDRALLGLEGVSLETIAFLHVLGAFLMLAFFIVHVYLITAGHTLFAHLKAMITGYEEVEREEKAPAES